MYLLYKKTKYSARLVHAPGNTTPHYKDRSIMKKFEDLMSVKNEIKNISASEAKDKDFARYCTTVIGLFL